MVFLDLCFLDFDFEEGRYTRCYRVINGKAVVYYDEVSLIQGGMEQSVLYFRNGELITLGDGQRVIPREQLPKGLVSRYEELARVLRTKLRVDEEFKRITSPDSLQRRVERWLAKATY